MNLRGCCNRYVLFDLRKMLTFRDDAGSNFRQARDEVTVCREILLKPFGPRAEVVEIMPSEIRQRELLKLMLKLPVVRDQLQLLSAKNSSLHILCEAYEDASSTLEWQRNRRPAEPAIVAEYEVICREIEEEVMAVCLSEERRGPPRT